MLKSRNHNIILPKYLEIVKKKGSSLNFSASGGRDKEKKEKPASGVPLRGTKIKNSNLRLKSAGEPA